MTILSVLSPGKWFLDIFWKHIFRSLFGILESQNSAFLSNICCRGLRHLSFSQDCTHDLWNVTRRTKQAQKAGEEKMKNMKLIMENFRKNMQEGWPGSEKSQDSSWSWGGNKEDAEAFVQKQLAKTRKSREDADAAIEAEKKQIIDDPQTPDEEAMGGVMLRLQDGLPRGHRRWRTC